MSKNDIKRCAQCGKVIPFDADYRKVYCDKKCKRAFHNQSVVYGSEAMAYAQVAFALKGLKAGKPPKGMSHAELDERLEVRRFAQQQRDALMRDYANRDKAAGRDPYLIVKARMGNGDLVFDKRQKVKPAAPIDSRPWFMQREAEK
jgi:hypothetical protein